MNVELALSELTESEKAKSLELENMNEKCRRLEAAAAAATAALEKEKAKEISSPAASVKDRSTQLALQRRVSELESQVGV